MSGCNISFHIQEEIMKRLPVKSLARFRSVSKEWLSLINSSEFITAHTLFNHTPPQHMLVSCVDESGEANYVCYIDDDYFPQHRYRPTLPLPVKQLKLPSVVGSSHGLLCLYGFDPDFTTKTAVIWNPSIGKSIVVALPDPTFVGFGVCPVTRDPKIVSIKHVSWNKPDIETKVMVYTLSSGKWKSLSTNLSGRQLRIYCTKAVTNGSIIYWRGRLLDHNVIISFDVTNESFEVVDLPDSLAERFCIFKLRESLAVVEYSRNMSTTVWTMEDGGQRSFTKLFNIYTPNEIIVGFRKVGIPLMQLRGGTKLVAYERNSLHNTVLEISKSYCAFYVNSYIETLGQFDCSSY